MKLFYIRSALFWFVLLAVAIINAIVREATYKPWLTPYIGEWAHQISSLTAIVLFYTAIYIFLKRVQIPYSRKSLVAIGIMWVFMTILFESIMNIYVRKLTIAQVLETYYVWNGETWMFVLISLLIAPLIAHRQRTGE